MDKGVQNQFPCKYTARGYHLTSLAMRAPLNIINVYKLLALLLL